VKINGHELNGAGPRPDFLKLPAALEAELRRKTRNQAIVIVLFCLGCWLAAAVLFAGMNQ
jgi:hypothetical protein